LATGVPILPGQFWPRLTDPQRKALAALLGEMLSRLLFPTAAKEKADEPR
jgi:hypothetical protein